MALRIHSPPPFTTNSKPYHLLLSTTKFRLTLIKCQNTPINTEESAASANPPKKPKSASTGQGFGSSSTSTSTSGKPLSTTVSKKKKSKNKRERATITRRAPVDKVSLISKEDEAKAKEAMKNESAFLLAWLGVGGIILVQGIALAASGFLPEELDKFFVKYLYPSFTPTVVVFVAGTVAYGVLKYLQNENLKGEK